MRKERWGWIWRNTQLEGGGWEDLFLKMGEGEIDSNVGILEMERGGIKERETCMLQGMGWKGVPE